MANINRTSRRQYLPMNPDDGLLDDEAAEIFGLERDDDELTLSVQTGCFRLGCAGKRITLDDLGGGR
jgi:hypothetical protein